MSGCCSDGPKGTTRRDGEIVLGPGNFEPESARDNSAVMFQFVLIGTSNVGKSAILHRFADDEFVSNHQPTIGVDYRCRTFLLDDKKPVKIQIWDTAGQERFRTLAASYYRRANGVLLVYDITEQKTFDDVESWMADVEKFAPPGTAKLLVGNKSDLADQRVVETATAKAFAAKHHMEFFETSAKQSVGVDQAFASLARQLIAKQEKEKAGAKRAGAKG